MSNKSSDQYPKEVTGDPAVFTEGQIRRIEERLAALERAVSGTPGYVINKLLGVGPKTARMVWTVVWVIICVALVGSPQVSAQDETPTARTSSNPDIPKDQLAIMLRGHYHHR